MIGYEFINYHTTTVEDLRLKQALDFFSIFTRY